jgi:hypothetical protein
MWNTDINTGDVKLKNGTVAHLGLKLTGGSGCVPDWNNTKSYNGPPLADLAKGKGLGGAGYGGAQTGMAPPA